MFLEYLIPHKHTLKILCKSKHIPRRYNRKREWVFFSEHSVIIESLAHTAGETVFNLRKCRKHAISKLIFIFFSGAWPTEAQTPNGQVLRRPSPDTALSVLRRFAPPENRSGTSVPPSALTGNKADL